MGRPKKEDSNPTDYKRGFNAQNYDRLYPWTKKGKKEFYTKAAQAAGAESLNEFIISAIEEKMKKDTSEIYAEMEQACKKEKE